MEWLYFILGLVAYQVLKLLVVAINQAVVEQRRKRILKLVNVRFPDNEDITFLSLDATDKRAMARLERKIREQYDIPDEDDDGNGDSGFDSILRRPPSPGGPDSSW